jgi:predicted Zn-dependent protease
MRFVIGAGYLANRRIFSTYFLNVVQSLGPTEQFHLVATTGWLELGSWREAQVELGHIPAEFQEHPDVLRVRWAVCAEANEWARAIEAAQKLAEVAPEDSFGCIHHAFALHELKRTREAWEVLLPVAEKFPKEFLIRYNLACYACQMGMKEDALRWLEAAIKLAGKEEIKSMALKDPDLASMKAEIRARLDT